MKTSSSIFFGALAAAVALPLLVSQSASAVSTTVTEFFVNNGQDTSLTVVLGFDDGLVSGLPGNQSVPLTEILFSFRPLVAGGITLDGFVEDPSGFNAFLFDGTYDDFGGGGRPPLLGGGGNSLGRFVQVFNPLSGTHIGLGITFGCQCIFDDFHADPARETIISTVPEPGTFVLASLGLLGFGCTRRR